MKKLILIACFAITLVAAQAQVSSKFYTGISVGAKSVADKVTITKITGTGSKVSFYSGSTLLNPVSADTVSASSILLLKSDSAYRKSGSYTSRYDFKYESTLSVRNMLNAAGSNITVTPVAAEFGGSNTTPALVDGTIYYNMVVVTDSTRLTSFQYSLQTSGVFTGDNNSVIGIYSFSAPTFTKIGNTATDAAGAKWKVGIGLSSTTNLVTPVWLAPGKYAIMYLYNSSAQTTAPSVYGISLPYIFILGTALPSSFYPFGVSNAATYTDLPASIAASAFTFTNNSAIIFGF